MEPILSLSPVAGRRWQAGFFLTTPPTSRFLLLLLIDTCMVSAQNNIVASRLSRMGCGVGVPGGD